MYIDRPNKNEVIDNLNHSGYENGLYTIYENLETVTIQYVLTNKCNLECSYCPKKFLYDESNFENIGLRRLLVLTFNHGNTCNTCITSRIH